MSEQNCDTSRTPTTNKNPLLSASVTGLTFDDFTNKAIILPAAALPPKLPEPKEPEPKKPAIFGTEPAILDTESFSEISLDQPSDQETYPSLANPLQDDQFSTDYSKPFNPLTQATQLTASLSQLPSVASSVFSSFSNILRGNSPTPNTSTDQQQIDPYNAPPVQTLGNAPFVNNSLAYPTEESQVPAAIPTFYSTNDPAFLPPAPTLSPPPLNTSSCNAYRLTTKRKIYAPAPGLTHQDNQPVSGAFPSHAPPLPHPINEPNFPASQPLTYENTTPNQAPSQSNKFSLTSFFSSPLLEKITGSGASHNQETPAANIPDVFSVQSTNPLAPVTAVNPGLFDSHPPVSENISTYSAQQPTYQAAPPLLFNPGQQINLPAVNQPQSSEFSTPEAVSQISLPPPSVPPSGNLSNYRLRGKPHYKNPLSSTATTTPFVAPFVPATQSSVPSSGIFNPVNVQQQVQSFGTTPQPSEIFNPNVEQQVQLAGATATPSAIFNPVNVGQQVQSFGATATTSGIFNPVSVEPQVQSFGATATTSGIFNPVSVEPQVQSFGATATTSGIFNPVSVEPQVQSFGATATTSGIYNPVNAEQQVQSFGATATPSGIYNPVNVEQPVQSFGATAPPSGIFNPVNVEQQVQSFGTTAPPSGIFNPVNISSDHQAQPFGAPPSKIYNPVNISSDQQVQSVGATKSSSQSSGFSHPPPPNVAFFNQPQSTPTEIGAPSVTFFNQPESAPVEQGDSNVAFFNLPQSTPTEISAPSVTFFNQPESALVEPVTFFNQPQSVPLEPNALLFNQFNPNNSGSANSLDPFRTDVVQQPSIQLGETQGIDTQQPVQLQQQQFQLQTEQQQNQSEPVQHQQLFQLQTFQQEPSHSLTDQQGQSQSVPQDTEKQSVFSSDQTHLPPSHQTSQSNLFQQFDTVKESGQLQQLFQQKPQPSGPGPFIVPTSHSQNIDQQTDFSSDLFTQFQPQNQTPSLYPPQTSSAGSVELTPYSYEEVTNVCEDTLQPQSTTEVLDNIQTQFTNLNVNQQVTEATFVANQENNSDVNLNHQTNPCSTDNKTSTPFDSFFGSQTTDQSTNITYPEPIASSTLEPITSSTLASSYFSTASNLSAADWFDSSKTVEPSTSRVEDGSNLNTQTHSDNRDASNFFATNNNNQISSPPNYFQIQNFFNNPPLIADSKDQDNNFIENNLINKRLLNLTHHKGSTETDGGSISSNIVEPPSSAQSEFSEFNQETTQSDEYLGEQQFPVDSSNTTTMAHASDQSNGGPSATDPTNVVYRPVYKHWFYIKKSSDQKPTWTPFPMNDSLNLEDAFVSNSNQCITTNGGRYDVNIEARTRSPVYWNGESDEVRRCSWFYKGADSRLVPYEESVADLLEEEYRLTSQSGEWNRKIIIPSGEMVMFQAPSIMVHFLAAQSPDLWPNTSVPPTANRPRLVKRGVDEFNIEDGEPEQINHLLFMVHGIGAGCDLKFRAVEEVVEDFRSIALQLTQSHYRSSCDRGDVGRIEVLPVSWHTELHSEESGIDEKLKAITLESIPKLRTFTNDTLLDILFYSSPVFCQKIMDTVAGTINRMYIKYCERNPDFKGNVSLAGHSLGSLILFDLLQNQRDPQCFDNQMDVDRSSTPECSEEAVAGVRSHKPLSRTKSRRINYTIGPAGTGQPFINYPQLVFHPKKFFALGSPIGMFVTVRGIDNLGLHYKLPTTDGFYNIFHPYDPVAYRIEALVNSELIPIRPVLIPHHKGRKRMHLELRETMARVGADIKQKIIDTFKSVYNFASLQKNDPKSLQQEVDKVLEEQLSMESSQSQRTRACSTSTTSSDDNGDTEFSLGMLNEGKRIDYVLQEAPLEFFNEYLFALTSHVCYWDSADTILFIVKEIYTSLGMQTDNQIPQQSMTIERPISTATSPTPADS